MYRQHSFDVLRACAVTASALLLAAAVVSAQPRGETFTADASAKRPDGSMASAKLTAVVQGFSTDVERDALIAAVGKGGTAARDLLAGSKDVGSIQVGTTKTAVKYAYVRTTGTGRLITLVTAQPIHFVGGDLPDAKPKAGYDLGLVLLEVGSSGPGHGEVAPAAKVRVDAQKAIVSNDYGAEVVRLSNVVRQ